jgi:hypothetical protein
MLHRDLSAAGLFPHASLHVTLRPGELASPRKPTSENSIWRCRGLTKHQDLFLWTDIAATTSSDAYACDKH